jgi:hypothetical protein
MGDYAMWGKPCAPVPPPVAVPPPDGVPPSGAVPPATSEAAPEALPGAGASAGFEPPPGGGRLWFTSEYLLWFVRGDPLHFPLVTTDLKPGTNMSGNLASPTAIVLFGGSNFNYNGISGTRQALGGWLDCDRHLGVEINGLLLGRSTASFTAGSNEFGNPPLYLPAFYLATGQEGRLIVADPVKQFAGKFAGNVAVDTSLRLWGMELDGIWNVLRCEGWSVSLVGGFRYINLDESLNLQVDRADLTNGNLLTLTDSFRTRDQFYGLQLAARASYTFGPITLRLTAETALGTTHQVVTIAGTSVQTGAKPFAGGFFTQPTNIGQQTGNSFSAVPQVTGRVDYHVTSWLTLFAGYDFLAWSSVVRPGDQIDRSLNLTQNPFFGNGTLVGTARPTPLFVRSDFIASGLICGLQLIY